MDRGGSVLQQRQLICAHFCWHTAELKKITSGGGGITSGRTMTLAEISKMTKVGNTKHN